MRLSAIRDRHVELAADRERLAIERERLVEIAALLGDDAAIVVEIGEARAIAHAFEQRLDLVEVRARAGAIALDRLDDREIAQRLHQAALVAELFADRGGARVLLDRVSSWPSRSKP